MWIDKQVEANEEKELEITRLQKDYEELKKKEKNANEKMLEYQSTNERLRKDKVQLEEGMVELEKKMELQEMLQKSAS